MIIYKDKGYEIQPDCPDKDWTGNAIHVVADGTELANKIIALYPYYDFVTDENGDLIDVVATEPPEPPEPVEPEPTAEEDLNSLIIDHEYRLTLLELGV